MGLCLLIVPFGPLLAWKRADALGAAQRLMVAAGLAVLAGAIWLGLVQPGKLFPALGLFLGVC